MCEQRELTSLKFFLTTSGFVCESLSAGEFENNDTMQTLLISRFLDQEKDGKPEPLLVGCMFELHMGNDWDKI